MTENVQNLTFRYWAEGFKHPPADSSGFSSDDLPWSDEAIVIELLNLRASVVEQFLSRGQKISDQMVQVLPCVQLEEVDRSECPCTPPSGCYWSRTVAVLPKYIKISAVTGIVANGEMPRFSYIKWDRASFITTSRIRSQREGLYWTTRDTGDNRHLYILGNRDLQAIAVTAIWENPMEAAAFPICGEVNKEYLCNPLDVQIYTDRKLVDIITPMAWQKLLPARQAAPADARNNDNNRS